MTKRLVCLLLCLLLCPAAGLAEGMTFAEETELTSVGKITRIYESPTLNYTVESFLMSGEKCFLTRVRVQDPARQILKVTAPWKTKLKHPKVLAETVPGAALAINGSGYVSPQYPWIPENYPGESEDYYYTPLGSLTVTDGEVFRNLEGVPYYGLALDAGGLQMYIGADNGEVLATNPIQTWSFYVQCPIMRNNEDLLPEDWPFADKRASRTIIARIDANNYMILSADSGRIGGITLRRAVEFFQANFDTEWVYNLDGGPSSALICRKRGEKRMKNVMGGGARDADVMVFTE